MLLEHREDPPPRGLPCLFQVDNALCPAIGIPLERNQSIIGLLAISRSGLTHTSDMALGHRLLILDSSIYLSPNNSTLITSEVDLKAILVHDTRR